MKTTPRYAIAARISLPVDGHCADDFCLIALSVFDPHAERAQCEALDREFSLSSQTPEDFS
jgi:hypothetical protein